MYNSVLLEEANLYRQCFLWRDLTPDTEPDTNEVLMNSIRVKQAGAVTTIALKEGSAMHVQEFPETTIQVVKDSYVDDLGLTASNKHKLKDGMQEAVKILGHAGLVIKR